MIITKYDRIIERNAKTAKLKIFLDHADLKIEYYKPVNGYTESCYVGLSLEDAQNLDACIEDGEETFSGIEIIYAPEIGWDKAYKNMTFIKEALDFIANAVNSLELDSSNRAKISTALNDIREIKI